jgi:putative hydrolase of the HAD superfamily
VPTEAVVFDLAGTLTVRLPPLSPREPWRRYTAALTADGTEITELTDRLVVAEYAVFRKCRQGRASYTFDAVLEMARVPYDPAAVTAYRKVWEPYTFAAPGAADLLRALRGAGIRTGLLSNTIWPGTWHRELLVRDGLLALLDAVVFSSEIDVTKPHPRSFRRVLRDLGDPRPGDCVFVGDRMYEDIEGAHGIGMRTVLVGARPVLPAGGDNTHGFPPSHGPAVPDAVVADLGDLLATFELGDQS